MSSFTRKIALACLFLTQVSIAFAQSEDEELGAIFEPKVSIATGSESSLRRAPAVATVITADDIRAMGARTLEQVLETVPGLHVSTSPISGMPIYVMRGLYGQTNTKILVLQNGMPLTLAYSGDRGPLTVESPAENIARIEVIRGPGSALYGADAFGGVINVITKGAANIEGTQVGANVGSFKTRNFILQHGGKVGEVKVGAFLQVGRTEGHKEIITADTQSGRDKIFGTKASLAPGPVNLGYRSIDANLDLSYEKWRLRSTWKQQTEIETGAGISFSLDPVGRGRIERITNEISWTDPQFAKNWGVGLSLGHFDYKQRITTNYVLAPPGTRLPTGTFPIGMIGHPAYADRQFRSSAYVIYSGFVGHTIRVGIGHDDINLYETTTIKNHLPSPAGVPIPQPQVADYSEISPFVTPHRRKVNYMYFQDVYQFHRDWSLTTGVRLDHFSDVGKTVNPRLALVWDASLNTTMKFLYGQAFRAPSFNELYGVNNPVFTGNPTLQPETIKTIEMAVAWQLPQKGLGINVNVFKSNSDKIIQQVANPVAGTGFTFQNAGKQTGRGLEFELSYEVNKTLYISGNYSYQKTTVTNTNSDAGNAPHHRLFGKAEWRFTGGWILTPQVNWVADRKRTLGDTRPAIRDYTSMDLSLRTTKFKNFDLLFTVRNLTNADAREPTPPGGIPDDMPLARRSFFFQAIYKL